jgi:leucyl/phenylalanyl-tRNA---protein transferase
MIKRRVFPDPKEKTIDGIVAMGDELSSEVLFEAYSLGIFPWPHPDLPCLWFCPDERGVLDFSDLHLSRSFEKFLRHHPFEVTFDQDFARVIQACAATPRPGQAGTWITSPLIDAYCDFHDKGYAHSVEVWHGTDLVGGLYGVYVGGSFSGESMFYRESNASKIALYSLVQKLKALGIEWLDIQMVTDQTKKFGGKYIAKTEFLERLEKAQARIAIGDQSHSQKY